MGLPVGYLDFHSDDIINYQLNRWYSFGYCREEDLRRAGEAIGSYEDVPDVLTELANDAEREGRLKNAAFYYRAAEFLTLPTDDRKETLYTTEVDTTLFLLSGVRPSGLGTTDRTKRNEERVRTRGVVV